MKKALSFLIVVSLCLSMLLTATSCALFKHPIEKFNDKMEKADSYQITITMSDVPFLGTITMTTKVDGNIQYSPTTLISEEEYIETDGDVEYKYSKNELGKWVKEKVTDKDDSEVFDEESFEELFNPKNYEKVKGEKNTYQQKDDVDFDEFKDVKITIEDDSCTIEMSVTSEGVTFNMEIVVSKIGEIELTLPEIG